MKSLLQALGSFGVYKMLKGMLGGTFIRHLKRFSETLSAEQFDARLRRHVQAAKAKARAKTRKEGKRSRVEAWKAAKACFVGGAKPQHLDFYVLFA
jgi:hypothetical protein